MKVALHGTCRQRENEKERNRESKLLRQMKKDKEQSRVTESDQRRPRQESRSTEDSLGCRSTEAERQALAASRCHIETGIYRVLSTYQEVTSRQCFSAGLKFLITVHSGGSSLSMTIGQVSALTVAGSSL